MTIVDSVVDIGEEARYEGRDDEDEEDEKIIIEFPGRSPEQQQQTQQPSVQQTIIPGEEKIDSSANSSSLPSYLDRKSVV